MCLLVERENEGRERVKVDRCVSACRERVKVGRCMSACRERVSIVNLCQFMSA